MNPLFFCHYFLTAQAQKYLTVQGRLRLLGEVKHLSIFSEYAP
jgi:hypothetical protein